MHLRERLWTYLLVTGVAVLIWYWAAAETRASRSESFLVQFAPSAGADQVVTPRERKFIVEIEGSALALERAAKLKMPIVLTVGNELPSKPGVHRTDIADILEANDDLLATGVSVVRADPPFIDLEIDDLVPVTAAVVPMLTGLDTEERDVDPTQATVLLPNRIRELVGDDLIVEAHLLQASLAGLEPGRTYDLPATLRLPQDLRGVRSASIDPPSATVSFKVKSHIKEVTLPTVRVQIAGPPEDHKEYEIEIADRALSDVTIKADGTLVQQIERGQVTVVALVHLSTNEKERHISSKPVMCFMAILPNGDGRIVDAEIAGSDQRPEIRLKITDRSGS